MRKTFQFLMLLLTGLIATGTLCANTIRQFYIEGKKFPGYSCQEFGASLNYVSSEPSPHCGFLAASLDKSREGWSAVYFIKVPVGAMSVIRGRMYQTTSINVTDDKGVHFVEMRGGRYVNLMSQEQDTLIIPVNGMLRINKHHLYVTKLEDVDSDKRTGIAYLYVNLHSIPLRHTANQRVSPGEIVTVGSQHFRVRNIVKANHSEGIMGWVELYRTPEFTK